MSQTGDAFLSEHVQKNGFTMVELSWSPLVPQSKTGNKNVSRSFIRSDRNDFSSLRQGVNLPDSVEAGWTIPIPGLGLHS